MNFKQFGSLLPDNPLCAIGTYKDELNLATGDCTKYVKKLVLTGEETEWSYSSGTRRSRAYMLLVDALGEYPCICSHYGYVTPASYPEIDKFTINSAGSLIIGLDSTIYTNVSGFKTYLQQQYAAGTPVIIWYVLSTPTTETITVPSGLSGTEEGYLNQSGTPTPTNPIYPTANTVEKWFDINHYIMETDTDTITTLPADIYANDTTATVGLKGQMEQSGTPTPTTPIQPSECGERTGNLLRLYKSGYRYDNSGNEVEYPSTNIYAFSAKETKTYTINWSYPAGIATNTVRIFGFYQGNPVALITVNINVNSVPYTFTTDVTIDEYRISVSNQVYDMIANEGSTPLSYEPYGIKIPILSNNTTTPVYLGEVQTTRMVKKWVLTGKETGWNKGNYPPAGGYQFFIPKPSDIADNPDWLTTHFKKGSGLNGSAFASYLSLYPEASILPENATINDFKAWLAAQYDAGTPVTIWYILAEPETAVANEPLRKIGDYADTVSGITIPTIAGANTLSVDTTLQPSEVTATYKGWHPVQSVHEKSRNLFDKRTVVTGERVVVNGVTSGEGKAHTGYIDVTGLDYISVSHSFADGTNIYFYSAVTDNADSYVKGTTAEVPQTAKYCRINMNESDIDTFMINVGSTALPYEPYWT